MADAPDSTIAPCSRDFNAALSHADALALVHYDPDTGALTRKVTTSPRARAGSPAGDADGKGYLRLRVNGRRYIAHRFIWFYMTGEWPEAEVDHINRNRADNRWANLRLATRAENKWNTTARRNNVVGLKGVSWHTYSRRWRSRIFVSGKEINLGLHDTPEAAHAAYVAAAQKARGKFAGS